MPRKKGESEEEPQEPKPNVAARARAKNWDEQIHRALANPIRRRIIWYLQDNTYGSFTELLKCVDTHDHGKLGFHLKALKGLIGSDRSRVGYHLTERGQLAYELILETHFHIASGALDLALEPSRYARRLKPGDHAVIFFDTEDIKWQISFPFLKAGLLNGEAVTYVVPEHKLDSEAWNIKRYGINEDLFPKDAFTIMSAEEWYLKEGKAQPQKMTANIRHLIVEKKKARFKGVRIAGEMGVFFDHEKSEELMQFEAALGRQLAPDLCVLCLYEIYKLNEEQFLQLNKSHGHSIFKGIAVKTI